MTLGGTQGATSGMRRVHLDTARHVLDMVVREGFKSGDHLSEQLVADRAGISRTPARAALRLLEQAGIVERRINRGYFLRDSTFESLSLMELPKPDDEALYLQIARDWFEGRLPESVTESDLRSTLRSWPRRPRPNPDAACRRRYYRAGAKPGMGVSAHSEH
jgi:hypothetical protein